MEITDLPGGGAEPGGEVVGDGLVGVGGEAAVVAFEQAAQGDSG
ncbi:hypothetical protein [Kitasatospora aureofaciens]|nr:hypothetical protein [Kitasatospora aureofaciens]